MGHICECLSFSTKTSRNIIQAKCDDWGNYNCDLEERGGSLYGLGSAIRFTDRVYDSREDAERYLNSTFGNYNQTAVRYKAYPKSKPTKAMLSIQQRIDAYTVRIAELEKPHYTNVQSSTVRCKHCGSSLATAYCGKSWNNKCPICGTDLRPKSTLDKLAKYQAEARDLRQQLKGEEKKLNAKQEKKAEMYWLVACEVHA